MGIGEVMPQTITDPNWGLPTSTASNPSDPNWGAPTFSSTNQKDTSGAATVDPNTLGTFASHVGRQINPVNATGALGQAVMHPIDTLQGLGAAQGAVFDKAKAAYQAGDYIAAGRHFVNYLLPIVGPTLDQQGDAMQKGQYAAATGDTVGLALAMFGGKPLGEALKATKFTIAKPNPNAAEAAAVQFGEQRGIPIDAGTATGSQFVRNLQKRTGSTMGGANVAESFKTQQAQALSRVGGDLAGESNAPAAGTPGMVVDPLRAGAGVVDALEGKIRAQDATANAAYDRLRQFEAQSAQNVAQYGGVQAPPGAARPFTKVPLAVDLSQTKTALKPVYDRLMREAVIAPPMGGKAVATQALDRLMRGPDMAPLSDVDAALGDLKAMARGADMPELRTQGRGIAAQAVQQLDAQVRQAATQAGPQVLQALLDGRKATIAKHAVADVRDLFNVNEPGQVFRELTRTKDVAVERLNAVAQHAPEQLPNIGRAVLEDMLDTATQRGGFEHGDKLLADWEKLGTNTKRMLFADQTPTIDKFLLLAKKIGENPNPSGTAAAMSATQIVASLPGWAVAKLLYSPTAAKMLTSGLSLSLGPGKTSVAAQAAGYAQVVRAARAAGLPSALVPAAAGDRRTGDQP